jgi:phosphate transport system permease protein
MAVTMVIGNRAELSASLFAPGYTLASVIANEFAEASTRFHTAALMACGAVLLGVTLLVNMIARWLVGRVAREAR